jgi:hypothetical protein
MDAVEAYILEQEGDQRAVLDYLHHLILAEPGTSAKLRYKIPFYYRKSWVCYANPREGGIELAFLRGNELSNEQGLLQARGRKQVSGVIFQNCAAIPEAALLEILQEALLLDESVPFKKNRRS